MKKVVIVILTIALLTCLFAGCQQTTVQETASTENNAGLANPMVEVESTDDFVNPMSLPKGTEGTGYYVIGDNIEEMRFTDADGNEYFARSTQDSKLAENLESFTGYYGEWKDQEGMGDIKYAHVKVDDQEYYVAHWQTEDGIYYCLVGPSDCEDQIVSYAEEMSGY